MKAILAFAAATAVLFAPAALAQDGAPAGYVMDMALSGKDASIRKGVARKGEELEVKLLMPLYDGDTVFVRDAASRIELDMGTGDTVEVGGARLRYAVKGEIDTGDSTWSLISAIGDALGGSGDAGVPDNMVSKGTGELSVPIAVHEANYVVPGARALWIGWAGGIAPFSIAVSGQDVPYKAADRAVELPMPAPANGRFAVEVTDASGHRVSLRFRLKDKLPEAPADISRRKDGPAKALAMAAWLSKQDGGAWRVAAAQLLDGGKGSAAGLLREALQLGWSPE